MFQKLSAILLALFPSFLQVPFRRLLGQKIGKGSKMKFGTIIFSAQINISKKVSIGPFCVMSAEQLFIDDNSVIKPLSFTSAREIKIGKYVHIAPLAIISGDFNKNSAFEIGDHSRVFPFCWLDTGEGIFIGKNVGIGGHSLLFTHGVWSNYLEGAPVTFGSIKIDDNVWLPWRVFILPNVEIGENTIVGANSLVNKSFPKNALIGGSPAKILKENVIENLSDEEREKRLLKIFTDFSEHTFFKQKLKSELNGTTLKFQQCRFVIDEFKNLSIGDLVFVMKNQLTENQKSDFKQKQISVVEYETKTVIVNSDNSLITDFISYLRRYGVRLYIN